MTYYSLCGSVALSNITNITCYNTGLGNNSQIGTQTLKIVSIDGGGSSLHATNGILSTEEIQIKVLDSYNFDDISFIKMDVEENELYVLQGSVELIKRCSPKILFECNGSNNELFNFFESINYSVININGYKNMYLGSIKDELRRSLCS
jgi:FkbM family methyltransferase